MVISGFVKKNMIILDKPIKLKDGTKVRISIPENAKKKSSGLCGIWEDSRSAEAIMCRKKV